MPLHLQERDVKILAEVGELGLLDSATIHRRHWEPGTKIRACQQRLKLLVDSGLLRPTMLQVAVVRGPSSGGTIPTIYGLTPKGAEVVEAETGHTPRRIQRDDVKSPTLLHRLEMIHARLGFDDAARLAKLSPPSWIMEYDSEESPAGKAVTRYLVLHQRLRMADGEEVSCRPDASSVLHIPRQSDPAKLDPLVVYWELDRSTNSHRREQNKAIGYEELLRQSVYNRHWPNLSGDLAVRIFYVCKSEERIAELRKTFATEHVGEVGKDFRFALASDVVPDRVLTEPVWSDTKGKRYQLLRRPA